MAGLEELRIERRKKIARLKEAGMEAYPARTERDTTVSEFQKNFERFKKEGAERVLAGRVRSLRKHGAITFFDLFDGTGTVQAYLKKEVLGDELFSLFDETVDEGDFVEVAGVATLTQRGVPSIEPVRWKMLTKSLRPIPDSFYGLKDEEERLRKRYLDILVNPETRALIEKRSIFWDTMRTFLKDRGFLEVETPTLEIAPSGAEATPFKTRHNDFDLDVYLRISVGELWQKKLMASGIEKTFEIGRIYRNEGSSSEHVQEFTNMECYSAYTSYREGMEFVRELYRALAEATFGKTAFTTRGHTFDLSAQWETIDYRTAVMEKTGIDVLNTTEKDVRARLKEMNVPAEGKTFERLIDTLWKATRKSISGPAFLINHPVFVSPLSKSHADNPKLTERFQVMLAGSEVGNGFSELNDPDEQRVRFENQQKLIEKGDPEAMVPDFEFVEALEYGIPPTFGFGTGERLFAFLADKPIREVTIFPLMKPKEG
jgi:lysyl-tRNA synthetase class 2